jgi:glutamate synthase (NADPH/NADH) large chain/glutamate synthase (ferredoxin)
VRTFDELIGRTDLLATETAVEHWKARGIDLTGLLASPELPEGAPRHRVEAPPEVLSDALDWELVEEAGLVVAGEQDRIAIEKPVRNVNRCVGGILSSEIARKRGAEGLPEDAIEVTFRGSAGQSFGGWLASGVSFTLFGDANDYTGKGLSGGVLAVRPPETVTFAAEENQLVGNTVLYGATSGRAFFRGLAGERFAVRNSGARAVVEGVGDHGCEYMTGGVVVVLGRTGRNFAAGMSGGLAFVLDEDGTLRSRCNPTMLDQLEPLLDSDAIELHDLISEHVRRTGSTVGRRVLDDFEALRVKFVKVFPTDYKRVLEQWAAEEQARNSQPVSTSGEGFVGTEGSDG